MKKRFLTIFHRCENFHLIKDVGMIPYILQKDYDYDGTIACYNNGDYPYLKNELKGVKLMFIHKFTGSHLIDISIFLLLNFRKFDIIQLYHLNTKSLFTVSFFKFLKKITFSKGVTYIKLDLNDNIIEKVQKGKFNLGNFKKKMIKNVDILSTETTKLYSFFNEHKVFSKEVVYIPNGFYKSTQTQIDFFKKENIILTVGRIGTDEKNNETLLDAFKDFAKTNSDWKVELIGNIEEKFELYIQNYFKLNPDLKNRVIFTPFISDRKLLDDKYNKAKIFVMTSKFESFGLVYLEAMKSGCTIISSDISPAYDFTDNKKYGEIFPIGDAQALSKSLISVVNNPEKFGENCNLIQDFAYKNFTWKKICGDINKLIVSFYK